MELMRLPARFRGKAFNNPVVDSGHKHADSIECTANLSQQIMDNGNNLMQSIEMDRKKVTVWHHEAVLKMKADDLQRRLAWGSKTSDGTGTWKRRLEHTHHSPSCRTWLLPGCKCWLSWSHPSSIATVALRTICLPSVHVEISTWWTMPRSASCLVSSTCTIMI